MAAGGSEFCLTSVVHYLTARAQSGALAARFVAVVVRRSPMAGIVAADSGLAEPTDLSGRRVGGPSGSKLVAEYQASLAHLGLRPSVVVPVPYAEAPAALGRGDVDVVPDFADLVPRTRRQAGVDVRAVRLPLDVYASGLVGGDDVAGELVDRMVDAVRAALQHQRAEPRAGLEELRRRYPEADPADAVEGWRLVEPNMFAGAEPGAMDAATWGRTIDFLSGAHRFPVVVPDSVFRPELAVVGGSR